MLETRTFVHISSMTPPREVSPPPAPAPPPPPSSAPADPSADTRAPAPRRPRLDSLAPRSAYPPSDDSGPIADPLFAWERPLPARVTPWARPARQIRSRHSRERLIAAVECVVRELGPHGATVRRIAARAGVSVGTIYRRFPNKAALLAAVQHRY